MSSNIPKPLQNYNFVAARFVRRAFSNKIYYGTFAAYGASVFALMIYVCDWKYVGKYIPVYRNYKGWNKQEEK